MAHVTSVRTTSRRLRCLLVLMLVALVAAGCESADQGASPESGDFSGRDVAFLQGMIPHHERALAMADLVPDRTERDELVKLVEDVRAHQEAELEEMRALLERSGAQMPDEDAADGDADEVAAFFTDDDGTDLRDLEGTPFELTFLDRLISHHRASVADAQTVLDGGEHPEVRAIAERIISARQGELARLEAWRDAWADTEAGGAGDETEIDDGAA